MAEVTFRITGWTPKTLPMERLGEYLVELASLYGEPTSVHFRRLLKGSAKLVSEIDSPAVPKVARRLALARRLDAPADLRAAFARIDDMLADDNAKGFARLDADGGSNVVAFPGREREKPIDFGAVRQPGFLEGEIVRIGGKDKSVHIQLLDGGVVHGGIVTDRETARKLGPLIFGPIVRLWGDGVWRRDEAGVWTVESFKVSRHEVMDAVEDLPDAIRQLQAVEGSRWRLENDPVAVLIQSRRDEDERTGT